MSDKNPIDELQDFYNSMIRECLFPNCSDLNIKSHAISESISLSSISENNHLYHFRPRQNNKTRKKEKFEKISLNQATRCYTFCKKHDNFFQVLDTNEIKTTKELLLQVIRSLGVLYKECVFYSFRLFGISSEKADTINIQKILLNIDIKDVKSKLMPYLRDKVESNLADVKELFNYMLSILDYNEENEILNGKFQTIFTENMRYQIYFYKTNFQIPVAINAIQHMSIGNEKLKMFSIVVPYETGNMIIGVIPNSLCFESLNNKIQSYFSSDLRIIEYIESIMSTCDDWYIKPSIIENMPEDKKKVFCEDCMFYNERKLFDEYDVSIFDDLKKKVVLERENEQLSKKISYIPQRTDYEVRLYNMINKIKEHNEADLITIFNFE